MPVKRTGGLDGKLKRLTSEMEASMRQVVETVAELVQRDAQDSITRGSAGGRSGGKHQHVPSAPGTPPNNFDGGLADGIIVENVGPLVSRVVSTARHGAIQELGGTVQNPGGQPYFIKDGEFIPVRKDSPAAARLPKTKPHSITLPERPYMRPAAARQREPALKLFEAGVDKALKGGKV